MDSLLTFDLIKSCLEPKIIYFTAIKAILLLALPYLQKISTEALIDGYVESGFRLMAMICIYEFIVDKYDYFFLDKLIFDFQRKLENELRARVINFYVRSYPSLSKKINNCSKRSIRDQYVSQASHYRGVIIISVDIFIN